MSTQSRDLKDSVIVITGASSGIGRATASAFARCGAAVVLAGRRADVLEDIATECRRVGGQALVVTADVTDDEAMRRLARVTVEHFGRLDVWINNAGIAAMGRLEDVPYEAHRRVIETNLIAYFHGAHAALECFRMQKRGVLINNGSLSGCVGMPYGSSYVASKAGVLGMSMALRQELADTPDIHICTVTPSTIDTPMFHHVANYTGRAVQALPPVYDVDDVARAIVQLAMCPQREKIIGLIGKFSALSHKIAPEVTNLVIARYYSRRAFQNRPAAPTSGNLFQSIPPYAKSGGWQPTRGLVAQARVLFDILREYPRAVLDMLVRR
jgi:short-subunit dehydrogenase